MPLREVTDGRGNSHSYLEVKGKRFPLVFDEETLENIPNVKCYPNDILLCGYLRSGTHWLFEMIHMLLQGNTDTVPMWKGEQMLEFSSESSLDKRPPPRVLNTHLYYHELPTSVQENKTVFVLRDPRDVAVSYYGLYKDIQAGSKFHGDWDYFLDIFLKGEVQWGSWFDFINSWEASFNSQKKLDVLLVYYEDIHKDPVETVRRLSSFLGLGASETLLKEIAEKCNFSNMKKDKIQHTYLVDGEDVMYRKGVTGDWRNWFSEAQSQLFENLLKEKVGKSQIVQRYLPTDKQTSDKIFSHQSH